MHEQETPCRIHVTYGDPHPAGLPVSVGVPFPAGMLTDPDDISLRAPGGDMRPAAGRILARHADGSIRWCLVSFGTREAGPHDVLLKRPAPEPAVTITTARDENTWTVDNGPMQLTVFEKGPGILGTLVCNGHSFLANPGDLAVTVDHASSRNETRRTIRVIEETPLRIRLRVEGQHVDPAGKPSLDYRLDIELWAGWPSLRLDYHYFNRIPNHPHLHARRIAVESTWNLGEETYRHFLQRAYGLVGVSRHVFNPAPVSLAADFSRGRAHVEDPAMLLDDVDYPFYLHPPLIDTHDWLGVRGEQHAVYVQMHDFLDARPNRLVSKAGALNVEAWPANAEPLELPQGRSRRQTVVFAFPDNPEMGNGTAKLSAAPTQAPKGIAALLSAPVHEGRASVDPSWIARCGEFLQDRILPAGRHIRIEANLAGLMHLDFPSSKFDVGDTDSHYNSSYSQVNPERVPHLAGAPAMPCTFPGSRPTQTYLDCHEPVWTNNEYDVIHAFSNELMRTGRPELWKTLRLAARHNIEVDFVHYSDHKWLHRATPAHSARHTTTGAYPSHFWTQGLLEYYCLTGDIDALETASALGDKIVENFTDPEMRGALWGFNREVGWSILALACLVDITDDTRFKPHLEEMVAYVTGFDRDAFRGGINLSGGNDRQSLNRQMLGNFFGYGSMMEGMDLYAHITAREDVIAWLTRLCHDLADEQLNAAREGKMSGLNFGTALAIGYERTGDRRFIDQMRLLLDCTYWNRPGVHGGASVKPVASTCRGLTRMLGHAWRQGLLEPYEYPAWIDLQDREIPGASARS